MKTINHKGLPFPGQTTRDEKIILAQKISDKLIQKYGTAILATGIYGSIGKGIDGPFSDIEMHVVTQDGLQVPGAEFIYRQFKVEVDTIEKVQLFTKARSATDMWAIKAGSFIEIYPIYDPQDLFAELKEVPFQITEEEIKQIMRDFMIWEPYETMGKIRNSIFFQNDAYLPLGAQDLAWQTAKLIGLANKTYYSTRANTWRESLKMASKPDGYDHIAGLIMKGDLSDMEAVYRACERLWQGLNDWYDALGIQYIDSELPL